jgi:hypothetical protein
LVEVPEKEIYDIEQTEETKIEEAAVYSTKPEIQTE